MTFRLTHLALLLALTTVLAAVAGVLTTYRVADREFRDVLDDDLESQSEFLAELLAGRIGELEPGELRELLRDTFEPDDEDTRWVSVYDTSGGRVISNLPHDLPLADDGDDEIRATFNGYEWHGYQSAEDDVVVQILRRDDLYAEVRSEILEDIVTPALLGSGTNLLLLGILLALLIWPLTRLARQLETRPPGSLEPVSLGSPATEIRVLRDALNSMMRGIEQLLARERQFTSDVAHELRTPLTTLKLELSGSDPDRRAMKEEVDRLGRLVEQLLILARLEQGEWRNRFEPVDLAALAHRVADKVDAGARSAGIAVERQLEPAEIEGAATLLETLLENLLTNVLRHCPSGTEVEVRSEALRGDTGAARLVVGDTGPGIPAARLEAMSREFTRLDSKGEGLGLGLAICRRIADVHGAKLAFRNRADGHPGLVVEVVFAR